MSTTRAPRDAVRTFIAADRSRPALERTHQLLDTGELRIRHYPAHARGDGTLFAADSERSFGRMAHGFIAASDWLGARESLSAEQQADLADRVVELARRPMGEDSRFRRLDGVPRRDHGAAFGSTSSRSGENFAAHLDARQDSVLRSAIDRDISLLASDSFYAGRNNHGMFQNIALLVAAAMYPNAPEPGALQALAFQRLSDYFSQCFTADGIHVENNPTYHVMVSRYLSQVVTYARACGAAHDFEGLSHVLEHAEEYAAHAVTPQGTFPPVSDTAVMPLNTAGPRATYPGEQFLGAITRGERGTVPAATAYVAEASGYAIHRSRWSDPQASYVFFSAAYNASYHKHSDRVEPVRRQ